MTQWVLLIFVVLIDGSDCEWYGFLYRSDKSMWKFFNVIVLLVNTSYEKISREYNIILESSVRNLLIKLLWFSKYLQSVCELFSNRISVPTSNPLKAPFADFLFILKTHCKKYKLK